MTKATVTTDIHQAFDAQRNLTPQLSLDLELLVDDLAEARHLLVGEILDAMVGIDVGAGHDLRGRRR